MKNLKKIMAAVLVVMMISAMAIMAFADGTDGKVTISNATVGVTYKAYKVFDATYDGDNIAYTVDATLFANLGGTEGTDFTAGPFTISGTKDSEGNFNVQLTDENTDAATIANWIKNNLTYFKEVTATLGLTSGTATQNTVEFGNLAYGYYYITSGLGSVVTIDSAKKEVTVIDKNPQTPTGPDKKITGEDAVIDASDETFASGTDKNDVAVGSKQSFKVTYQATNYVTEEGTSGTTTKKVKKFYIVDQPRNMTIDPTSIKVDVNGTVVIENGAAKNSTTNPATVSVASGDAGKLEITIDWVDNNGNSIYSAADGEANIPVTLTYDAVILKAAATENADNTVTVKYDRDGDSGSTTLGSGTTESDTYKFKLEKKDPSGSLLTGAKFELNLSGTKLVFVDDSGTKLVYRVAGSNESGSTTIEMGSGTIEIRGLDKKDYSLVEIEAPKGYNLLTEEIPVNESDLTKADVAIPAATKITVTNEKGSLLPSTGGIGTTIFYVVGAVLVIGSGIVLVTKKRMGKEEN